MADKISKGRISMTLRAFKEEHRELAKLSVKNPKLVKREAKEQGEELKRVIKKTKKK